MHIGSLLQINNEVCVFPTVLPPCWFHLVEEPQNFQEQEGNGAASKRFKGKAVHLPGDRIYTSFLCRANPAVAPRADWCAAWRDSGAQNEQVGGEAQQNASATRRDASLPWRGPLQFVNKSIMHLFVPFLHICCSCVRVCASVCVCAQPPPYWQIYFQLYVHW